MLKKEAPELLPLLQDFQSKLEDLSPLLPLLKPGVLSQLPASGASYCEVRLGLLLNQLANLSFYLMLKAEGGDVRSHPVVSQLVWLRQLDQHLDPVNKRIKKKLHKAAKGVKAAKVRSLEPKPILKAPIEPVKTSKAPLTLAERLGKLREKVQPEVSETPAAAPVSLVSGSLLKMPRKRRAMVGDGPADLDELDPTLGAWLPSTNLSQQLSEVQQHLRERKTKSVPQASDKNPEARARVSRGRETPREAPKKMQAQDESSEEENQMVREARAKAKAKKEQKNAALMAKEKAKVAKQYHPEVQVEARPIQVSSDDPLNSARAVGAPASRSWRIEA